MVSEYVACPIKIPPFPLVSLPPDRDDPDLILPRTNLSVPTLDEVAPGIASFLKLPYRLFEAATIPPQIFANYWRG